MGQKKNYFMEKNYLKGLIQDIDYTPVLYGPNMTEPPANIQQVNEN